MKSRLWHSVAPLIATIEKRFSADHAKENDFLQQENKILCSKLDDRVPMNDERWSATACLSRSALPV